MTLAHHTLYYKLFDSETSQALPLASAAWPNGQGACLRCRPAEWGVAGDSRFESWGGRFLTACTAVYFRTSMNRVAQ